MERIIYKLTNRITGKSYVGQTKDLQTRLSGHKCCAGNCRYLHNAIRKYGWENFVCEVLERCTEADVWAAEGRHIVLQNTLAPNGYNLTIDNEETRIFSEQSLALKSHASQKRELPRGPSGFIGVVYNGGRPALQMRYRRKLYGAPFDTEIEAAEAYDRLAVHFHGPNARINFIDNLPSYLTEDLETFCVKICTKPPKTSKYPYVCWHGRHKRWMAYAPLDDGRFKTLGVHATEEEAHDAVVLFQENGIYVPSKPSEWKQRTLDERVLSRSKCVYIVESPSGEQYKTVSLKSLADAFGVVYESLRNSWMFKRPAKRGVSAGWNVLECRLMTPEERTEFKSTTPYTLWQKLP